jgi:cytosine/adenosine deaminase-related metal-dependent hydrolase
MIPSPRQEILLWPDALLGAPGESRAAPVGVRAVRGRIEGVHRGRDLRDWVEARIGPGAWERQLRGEETASPPPAGLDGPPGSRPRTSTEAAPGGAARLLRLPRRLLAPGFVNAHAHLELTALEGRVEGGRGFSAWIRSLLEVQGELGDADWPGSFAKGAKTAHDTGTTLAATVVRPSTLRLLGGRLPEPRPRLVLLAEILGYRPEVAGERLQEALGALEPFPEGPRVSKGLSPHAPYSTSPELYRAAARESLRRAWPLVTHLAESSEEVDFIRTGAGPLQEILEERDQWPDEAGLTADDPVAYLEKVGVLDHGRLALVHGTLLGKQEARALARRRHPVVYCPGATSFFGVERYPLEVFLDEGVSVALGTDSLASAPTLDMREVLRLAARRHPRVPRETLLEMATLEGARALGIEDAGRVEPGFRADLQALEFTEDPGLDPWGALFEGEALSRNVISY